MREINATNYEVGYHYEELSSLGKQLGVRTAGSLRTLIPQARTLFADNLTRLRDRSKLSLTSAAAHGDWLNRLLGVSNTEVLADESFRSSLNITSEAYDPVSPIAVSKHIDRSLPMAWQPLDPMAALRENSPVVYLTLHPRQWGTNIGVNLKENFLRTIEGTTYRLRTWLIPS
ncbi:MAG: hypothetical protein N3B12_06010 [Armatimonadetes bacterium]|nr:hypothetical protein [Armatimonadota bacterium]